jgi:hypothetical protein
VETVEMVGLACSKEVLEEGEKVADCTYYKRVSSMICG